MTRAFMAATFLCLFVIPAEALVSGPDSIFSTQCMCYVEKAEPTKKLKRVAPKRALAAPSVPRTIFDFAAAQASPKRGSRSLVGFPAPLVAKVRELESACGSKPISAFGPGASIAGTGPRSVAAARAANQT